MKTIPEIVDEFREKFDDQTDFGTFEMCHWLTQALQQHEIETKLNLLEEIEDSRDNDSCECDNCNRWRVLRKKKIKGLNHALKHLTN